MSGTFSAPQSVNRLQGVWWMFMCGLAKDGVVCHLIMRQEAAGKQLINAFYKTSLTSSLFSCLWVWYCGVSMFLRLCWICVCVWFCSLLWKPPVQLQQESTFPQHPSGWDCFGEVRVVGDMAAASAANTKYNYIICYPTYTNPHIQYNTCHHI